MHASGWNLEMKNIYIDNIALVDITVWSFITYGGETISPPKSKEFKDWLTNFPILVLPDSSYK